MKVLLLDDDVNILSSIERVLAGLGHLVDTTNDAAKAAVMIENGEYDFALIDYSMPIHDGAWFMRNARIPKSTKVLLMTAHVDREVIKEMLGLGARGYLIKPIDREELVLHFSFHSGENRAT